MLYVLNQLSAVDRICKHIYIYLIFQFHLEVGPLSLEINPPPPRAYSLVDPPTP